MRAVRCERYGDPDVLEVRELPDPVAGPGDVLVGIEAAGVNFPDVLMVADKYQLSIPVPFTPGAEFAGRVLAVGAGVTSFTPGDAVMGGSFLGGFADRIVLPEAMLAPVPNGLDLAGAAAFGLTYRTAYHSLVTTAAMQAGEWVVVLGAAGGVGSAAVDIATRLGGRVIAAAATPDRLAVGTELGAVAGIAYGSEDLKARIKDITGGGADVIIDPVGGVYAEQAIRAGAWGSRYVTVGFADGAIPKIPMNLLLLKGVTLKGFDMRTLPQHQPREMAAGEQALADLIAGGLRPHVSKTYTLAQVPQALEAMRARAVRGKIVIDTTR